MKTQKAYLESYEELNRVCHFNGTVLFGATTASKIHVSELAQSCALNQVIYNRSLPGLSVFGGRDVLKTCVLDLCPDEVFVQLGEEDLSFENHTLTNILTEYEWLLYEIHGKLPRCTIKIVSVPTGHANSCKLNRALENLANQAGCGFVDMTPVSTAPHPEVRAFSILKGNMHQNPLCFGDAMNLATVG